MIVVCYLEIKYKEEKNGRFFISKSASKYIEEEIN